MLVGLLTTAQTATFNIASDNTMKTVNTDYTLTNTTVVWFQLNAARDMRATQDYEINIDSVSGNHTNIAIKLYGRVFSDDSWTQIGSTANSTHTATHTVTSTISNTVANRYRQYKFEFTPTGTGVSTIDFQKFKLWNE